MLSLKYAAYAACAAGVVWLASRPLRVVLRADKSDKDAQKQKGTAVPAEARSLIARSVLHGSSQSGAKGSPQQNNNQSNYDQKWLESGVLNAVLNVAQWPLDYLEKSVQGTDASVAAEKASEVLPPATEPVLSIARLTEAKKNMIPSKSIYYKDIDDEAAACLAQQQQARKSKIGDSVGEKKGERGIWRDPDFGPEDSSLSQDLVCILRSSPDGVPQTSAFVEGLWKLGGSKQGASLPWKIARDLTTTRKQPGHRSDGEGTWLYLDLNELQGSPTQSITSSKKQFPAVPSVPVVGNRYFSTALVLVLQNNPLMCDSLIDLTHEAKGIYGVSFFVDGKWAMVWIDSYFPCLPPTTGALSERPRPIFPSATDPREFWTMVVEKAYAKLNRSYEAMLQVPLNTMLENITGGDSNLVELTALRTNSAKSTTIWRQIEKAQLGRNGNGGVRSFGGGSHITFIAATSRQSPNGNVKEDGQDGMQGIAYGHVYAVVAAIEVAGNKLLQLRSPPATGGWTGDWSPSSATWESEGGMAARAAIESLPAQEKGDFWMPFADFIQCFDTMATLRMKLSADELKLRAKLLECVSAAGVGRSALTPGLELRYRHLMQQAVADKMAEELISAELPKRKKAGKTTAKAGKSAKAEKGQQRGNRKAAVQ